MNLRALGVLLLSVSLAQTEGDSLEGNLNFIYKTLEKCNIGNDIGTCLRLKALTMLDKALVADTPIVVNDFLTITRDKELAGNSTARSESEIETDLPLDPDKKGSQLDEMIADRMLKYLQSRSLQFTIPADIVQGRKRGGKRGGMMMMVGLAMGGMMVQMAMGKVALLAGKALLVGKMALLLSGIIAIKKLVGGGGGGGDSHPQVIYAESHGGGGGGGHGGWGRSYVKKDAQEMAYQPQARTL